MLFKQRDNRFYPPSAWSLAMMLVRVPFQLVEAALFAGIIYFWVGKTTTLAGSALALLWHAESQHCVLWGSCIAFCLPKVSLVALKGRGSIAHYIAQLQAAF